MQFLKNIRNSRGFTLIELLVVITIIGIIATGGTVTYTSQIQKARDTTRISDMKALQSGLEQFYQDKAQYPDSGAVSGEYGFTGSGSGHSGGVVAYVPKLPLDPKSGQSCSRGSTASGTACAYLYVVVADNNGITNGEYKISAGLENTGNVDEKAAKDGGVEASRLEMGLDLIDDTKSTTCVAINNTTTKTLRGVHVATATNMCSNAAGFTNPVLVIAGNNP